MNLVLCRRPTGTIDMEGTTEPSRRPATSKSCALAPVSRVRLANAGAAAAGVADPIRSFAIRPFHGENQPSRQGTITRQVTSGSALVLMLGASNGAIRPFGAWLLGD